MGERLIKHAPRVRGHSMHPPLTDFPIALLAISLVWDIVAIMIGGDVWWTFAFWCQVAGLIAVIPAALTGFIEYVALPEEHAATSTATRHMLVMITVTLPYVGSVIVRGGPSVPSDTRMMFAVLLNVLGLLLLLIGGWLGGELVSRHGLGTRTETESLAPQEDAVEDLRPSGLPQSSTQIARDRREA